MALQTLCLKPRRKQEQKSAKSKVQEEANKAGKNSRKEGGHFRSTSEGRTCQKTEGQAGNGESRRAAHGLGLQ